MKNKFDYAKIITKCQGWIVNRYHKFLIWTNFKTIIFWWALLRFRFSSFPMQGWTWIVCEIVAIQKNRTRIQYYYVLRFSENWYHSFHFQWSNEKIEFCRVAFLNICALLQFISIFLDIKQKSWPLPEVIEIWVNEKWYVKCFTYSVY